MGSPQSRYGHSSYVQMSCTSPQRRCIHQRPYYGRLAATQYNIANIITKFTRESTSTAVKGRNQQITQRLGLLDVSLYVSKDRIVVELSVSYLVS